MKQLQQTPTHPTPKQLCLQCMQIHFGVFGDTNHFSNPSTRFAAHFFASRNQTKARTGALFSNSLYAQPYVPGDVVRLHCAPPRAPLACTHQLLKVRFPSRIRPWPCRVSNALNSLDFEQDKGEEMKHGAGLVPEHAKCRDLEQISAEPVNQRVI